MLLLLLQEIYVVALVTALHFSIYIDPSKPIARFIQIRSGPFLKFYDFVYMPNCAPRKFGQYNKMGRLSCRIVGFYPAVNAMVHKNIRAEKSKKRRIDELCVYFAAVIAADIYLQEATET